MTVDTLRAAPAQRRRAVNTRWATLRGIYMIWWRDLIRFWRDRTRLLGALVQPLLFLVILGTGLSSALRGAGGGFGGGLDYQVFMYPGIIGMAVLFSSIFSGMSIIWDREFGFLKEVLVAPIDRSAVAIGKILGGATQAMFQGVILLVLAPFFGVKLTPLAVLEVIGLIFCVAFALSGVGVAIASRMRSMMGFQFVLNFLVQPAFFLSGAMFPVTGLPGWMTALTRIDPLTYGVDPIRRIVLDAAGVPVPVLDKLSLALSNQVVPLALEAAIVLGFGLLMMAIAVFNFRKQE
ncbi:MAG TPA: ABC transporter permease [Candidatus Dormibacteraeota bacterium]|nr:ABC transporter permease [Candidatus Dormibacteraeota bacterium]